MKPLAKGGESESIFHVSAAFATAVHTIAYLAVTGLIAWVVYSKFGLAILRKDWINLNLVWAAALVVTSLVTLLMYPPKSLRPRPGRNRTGK